CDSFGLCCLCVFFFFFSSRRRHTRSYGDWSSDVCSSDLHSARPGVEDGGQVDEAGGDCDVGDVRHPEVVRAVDDPVTRKTRKDRDRKSTRLNSSHRTISYAVFCLKKKKKIK